MEWWSRAVRELSEDTLEQVTSGLGYVKIANGYELHQAVVEMEKMTMAELSRRSRAAQAEDRIAGGPIDKNAMLARRVEEL